MTSAKLPQQHAVTTVAQSMRTAVALHRTGRLQDAERLYRAILRVQPNHADANHNLGVLAVQQGQPVAGLPYFKVALEADPKQEQYWLSYIDALIRAGQSEVGREALEQGAKRGLPTEAVGSLVARLGPGPQEIEALLSAFNQARYLETEMLARVLTVRFPQHDCGWKGLGAVYQQTGRTAKALVPAQNAVALRPGDAEAHSNLGFILKDLGRLDDAEAGFRRALEIDPDYLEARYNLANVARALERLEEAEIGYRQTLGIKPDFTDGLNNFSILLHTQGRFAAALRIIQRSMQVCETDESRRIFVACAKCLRWLSDAGGIRATMTRALIEPWNMPAELATSSIGLVRLNPEIKECMEKTDEAWPRRLSAQALFGSNRLATLAADPLLRALLVSVPICDIGMERFLTMVRHALLEIAIGGAVSDVVPGPSLDFHAVLARQCFINEYVFCHTDEEIRKAGELKALLESALTAGSRIPVLLPVTVGTYFPLSSVNCASLLFDRGWSEEVEAMLVQQIREPAEEFRDRSSIPRLTGIEDAVSIRVHNQYEENPYPRWVRVAPAGKAKSIQGHLRALFPRVAFDCCHGTGRIDVLVAGCGTGQHSIDTAGRYPEARVLAVDLSVSSLAYAKRKTRELGLTTIEYAQADILKLDSIGRQFDVIESVGVLHHLGDPWAGWRVLLSLLRPGGFMRIGLYSEIARRNIVRAREVIAELVYGSSADEIRRCRQVIVDRDGDADFGTILKSPDFFTVSGCRDLLFHVQEHRMTLSDIDAFLREHRLAFLGFETDLGIIHAYRQHFPDDPAATNLDQWQMFENQNPDMFSGMYQFWVQRTC